MTKSKSTLFLLAESKIKLILIFQGIKVNFIFDSANKNKVDFDLVIIQSN
jgi:hypothetical protein